MWSTSCKREPDRVSETDSRDKIEKASLSYVVAVLADSEDQAFRLNRLELGGDLEHARARVDRGVLVVPCAVVCNSDTFRVSETDSNESRKYHYVTDDAGLVGGGAAARAVAVADGAAVGLDEEVERAVAVAAVLCSRFL